MASNLRIGGLASGMEIDLIIKELMAAARKPVDKLYQDKTFLEWKKNDYRTINNQLRILRDEVSKMCLQSTYLSRKVVVGDTSVVTATSSNNAATTSYTIKVDQLAEVARNESREKISDGKVDPNQTIWSQRHILGLDSKIDWIYETVTDEIKVTTASTNQKLTNDALTSIPSVIIVKDADGQDEGTAYTVFTTPKDELAENEVYLDLVTGELIFGKEIAEDSIIEATYTYNTKNFKTTFTIHDESGPVTKEYIVEAGNLSLNSLFNRMSANRELGIAIYYDEYTDKVSISTNKTGDYNPDGDEILFGDDKFFTKVLRLINGADGDGNYETGGTNAKFILNGLSTERKNNEFTINGTTFTLQGTTDMETTVNVMHDGDTVFDSIKSFIEKYNELIGKVNTKLTEQRYRDYPPLTNEQKKEMSEDEIKLWEEKAKSGTLRSDSLLSSVLDKMRFAWGSPVKAADSKFDQMTEYGIETGSYFEGGKLYIKDEARLKQAINENPDEVLKFFT
ncbi:MAG TPA: flagellar filament capping protein FliD, partial [Clostridia bacterium]|nr:flagellar filament capping protein FliD [Clostridia bacterium]